MPKKETAQSVLPHTEAKLQLYINYLERYLAILLRAKGVSQINIYDMFCGEGLYRDGKSGSAVRAVEAIWAAVQSSTKKVTVNLEKMEWLREKLFSLLESSEINNFDLYELTIESGYLPKHMNTILKKMQRDELIVVTDKFNGRPARKGAFKINYQNWRDKQSEHTIALQSGGGS